VTARTKRTLSIVVLAAVVAAVVTTFVVSMSTEANAPPHRVTVIGDPTIADGPGVLKEMERDATKAPIGVTTAPSVGNVAALVLMIVWIVTGILILTRQPGNKAGWVFLAIGVAWIASALAVALVTWDVRTRPGVVPLRALLALMGEIGVGPLILIPLLFILFPDGRPPSPRWRWVVWALVGGGTLAIVGTLINPGPLNNFVTGGVFYENPAGLDAFTRLAPVMIGLGSIVALVGAIASVLGVRSRFKRSTGEARQQLRWLVTVATVALAIMVLGIVVTIVTPKDLTGFDWLFVTILGLLVVTVAGGIPAAYLIAIFRYGLWDLDVVIKKTVVFSFVVVLFMAIGAVVAGLVGIIAGEALYDAPPLMLLLGLIAGLLALPLYRLATRIADRVVYGGRSSPYEVLTAFSSRVGETYASEDVLQRMATTLGEGTGAEQATVWLRFGNELRPEASWPSGVEPAASAPDDAIEVRHRGEVLGALSVAMPASDPMNPAKERLVRDLASQAGPVLGNVRLIEELRASRQRLVAAQDEERRKLERNIHDGVQQQLVALAVKLKLVDTMIDRDTQVAHASLAQLQTDAQQSLEDLRDLARGVYPPLLADKGLVAALESQARRAPIPVTLAPDGIGRYGRDVEATVYFCALEALNNVAKYADASGATIELAEHDGTLHFRVVDDGTGFDRSATSYGTGLQGMADRLDAVGGSLTVESQPGSGTSVTGSVPIGEPVTS
jgi:signal transduction histidine kinase